MRRVQSTWGLIADLLLVAAFIGVVVPDGELVRAVCGVAGAVLLAVRVLAMRRRFAAANRAERPDRPSRRRL